MDARPQLLLDDRIMRIVFAAAAALVGAATIVTRNEPAVDLSLISPTVAVVALWAAFEKFPRLPVYFLGIVVPQVLNIIESDDEVSMFLVVLTAAVAASFEKNRVLANGVIAFTFLSISVLSLVGVFEEFATGNWLFGVAFSWGFGEIVYRYSQAIEELGHARLLVADQAALHERRRIARDVHDLVGHSLSVVMLHVTGARHLVRKDPDEAERALEQAEIAGRESLAEIRRTVGLLRDDRDGAAGALPSPDLTDVSDLVNEFVVAGLDIKLDLDRNVDVIEGASALAGYRIVQEALTNASRHTAGAEVLVNVAVGPTSYDVEVRNSGGMPTDARRGSGFGLVSMRERARSVGGSLVAGPTPTGWMVEATLPISVVEAL